VVPVAEQTALALADTPVGVTMLCPALVRSAMSPTVDPADVADEALHAVHEGRFAVVPEAWRGAILQRAEHLVRGQLPVPPHPPDRRHAGAV